METPARNPATAVGTAAELSWKRIYPSSALTWGLQKMISKKNISGPTRVITLHIGS